MMSIIYNWLKSYLRKEEGQTLSEYGLIIVLVALAVLAALTFLGGQLDGIFNYIGNILNPPAA